MESAKVCRLCLKVKTDMRPLEEGNVLKNVIKFSNINVEKINGWPDKVCIECIKDVSYCCEVKKRIEKSEQQLLDMDEIAKEPLSEEDVEVLDTESDEEQTIILSDSSNNSIDEDDSEQDDNDGENSIIFMDLTFDEVVEVEDHNEPNATSEKLEEISKIFLESIDTDSKKLHPNITLRRKRCTTNRNATVEPPSSPPKGFIRFPRHLLSSTPKVQFPSSYLVHKASVTVAISEPQETVKKQFPKFVQRSSVHKQGLIPEQRVPTPVDEFLESLDDKAVPIKSSHPEALKFRTNFEQNKDELVRILIAIYNEKVFNKLLDDVPFRWSKTLRKTGGRCWYKLRDKSPKVLIELSDKVLTSADRVRDVLIHELCHAAVWLLDERRDNHGEYWLYWSMAHSKSKRIENTFCTRCHGPLEVFFNKRDTNGNITLIPPKN